jgi:hypothetical protein
VKIEILLNNELVDPLAFVCHRTKAQSEARVVCEKLQKVLPRQQFVTVIQAKADGKIIASERIRAYRKDVLTTGGSKAVGKFWLLIQFRHVDESLIVLINANRGWGYHTKEEAIGKAEERKEEAAINRQGYPFTSGL